jgi:hypothetical protein
MTAMSNFIEDYLQNPSQAISSARERADRKFSFDSFDQQQIYKEMASPEFHLYEAMVMSDVNENTPRSGIYAVVA